VSSKRVKSIRWESGNLYLLDQTKLPHQMVEEKQNSIGQVWDSIKQMKVRGAPAIAIAGVYGLVIGMKDKTPLPPQDFMAELYNQSDYLKKSRPTAVNLTWALNRVINKVKASLKKSESTAGDSSSLYKTLIQEAEMIHREDEDICKKIGENGLQFIMPGMGILTYCNAGALATGGIGTATAPMYLAHEKGIPFHVFACESRPVLQGARLTAWELQRAGIDVTLITDNMASILFARGMVDMVMLGADRVAANGDTANKIGTLGIAIMAQYYSVPFYVALPISTIDVATATGREITIEERDGEEVTSMGGVRIAPEGVKVINPAFDVTPGELITAFITEKGIISKQFNSNLAEIAASR